VVPAEAVQGCRPAHICCPKRLLFRSSDAGFFASSKGSGTDITQIVCTFEKWTGAEVRGKAKS
jgi:hypothetical protein